MNHNRYKMVYPSSTRPIALSKVDFLGAWLWIYLLLFLVLAGGGCQPTGSFIQGFLLLTYPAFVAYYALYFLSKWLPKVIYAIFALAVLGSVIGLGALGYGVFASEFSLCAGLHAEAFQSSEPLQVREMRVEISGLRFSLALAAGLHLSVLSILYHYLFVQKVQLSS